MKKVFLIILCCFSFPDTSLAERVLSVDFTGQPLMNLNKGVIQACGIRYIGVEAPANPSNLTETVWVSDASFMLDRSGVGIVKAVINKSTVGDIAKGAEGGKIIAQEFKTFWMKPKEKAATHPLRGEAVDGENKPSKIYITDMDSITNLYDDVLQERPIMLGLQFEDGNDFAFSGVVRLKNAEINQVTSCMGELLSLIEKDIEK